MRNCPGCSPVLKNQLQDRIKAFFGDDQVYFVTLTKQADDQGNIKDYWHQLQDGPLRYYYPHNRGFWTLEKTSAGVDHLHALMTSSLDPGWLSRSWHSITKTSFIVDVQPAREIRNPAGYMLKYLTKQHSSHAFAKGTRMYGFFGARAPPVQLLGFPDDEDQEPGEFQLDQHFNQDSTRWTTFYQELQLQGGPAFIEWMEFQLLPSRMKDRYQAVNITGKMWGKIPVNIINFGVCHREKIKVNIPHRIDLVDDITLVKMARWRDAWNELQKEKREVKRLGQYLPHEPGTTDGKT